MGRDAADPGRAPGPRRRGPGRGGRARTADAAEIEHEEERRHDHWGWNWSSAKTCPGVAVLDRRDHGRGPQRSVRASLRPDRAGHPGLGAGATDPDPGGGRHRPGPPGRPGPRGRHRPLPVRLLPDPHRPGAGGDRGAGRVRRAAAGGCRPAGPRRASTSGTRRGCRVGSRPGRCSAPSTPWSSNAVASSSCSASTTGSRSTCRRPSGCTATTSTRSCWTPSSSPAST